MWAGASPFFCQRTKLSFASEVNSVLFYWLQEHQEGLFLRTDLRGFIRKVLDLISKVKMYAAVPEDLWLKFKQRKLLWKPQVRNAKLRRMELAWELCELSSCPHSGGAGWSLRTWALEFGPPQACRNFIKLEGPKTGRVFRELNWVSQATQGEGTTEIKCWAFGGSTDSKTLGYHRTNPKEYQTVRRYWRSVQK